MIESVGVGFKEQIKGEQKLIGKNNQLLSDIKIGDVLKGSLTKLGNGQTVLLQEDGGSIPVKLQGMAIFNENVSLEVIQKEAGQVLLKLLQSEESIRELLQHKIIKELGLPETDPMRQLIEIFLAKQMPLQREGLLKNYHMHQSFQIPAEVLTNLSEETGSISLQEAKGLYEMKQTNLEQALTSIGDIVSELKNDAIVKDIYNVLEKYLNKNIIKAALNALENGVEVLEQEATSSVYKELIGQMETAHKQEVDHILKLTAHAEEESINNGQGQKNNESVNIDELLRLLTPYKWEKLGKVTKELILKSFTVDTKRLEETLEESKHIENANKVLKDILKVLEEAKLPGKYESTLKHLEENVHVLNKFNMQGEYYFFPLSLPQGEGKGELYFFKPKKKANDAHNHLYVVLALDLPKLKNIEIHIQQEKENLLLHFKVKEEGVVKLLEAHLKNLKHLMGQTKFNVDEIKVSLIEEKNLETLLTTGQNTLSHMDFKI